MKKVETERWWKRPDWYLVMATFLVGFGVVAITWCGMHNQVEAMKAQNAAFLRVSDQESRPYPVVSVDTVAAYGMTHRIGQPDTVDGEITVESEDVRRVIVGSHTDKAKTLTTVGAEGIVYRIKNTGRLPLYITGFAVSAELPDVWSDTSELNKDYTKLCQEAISCDLFTKLETDVPVLPGESIPLKPKIANRTLSPAEFERYRDREHRFVLYPYIYIQYEDPFEREYDVLYMGAVIFKLGVVNNRENMPVTSLSVERVALEKFRWDVLLSPYK